MLRLFQNIIYCIETTPDGSGAAIGGVVGVRTPPIIWMGGLNPLNNIDKKLNKMLIKNLNIYYIYIYITFLLENMYTHTSKGVVTYNKGFTIDMEYNKAYIPEFRQE